MIREAIRRLQRLVVPEGVLLLALVLLDRGAALPNALARVSPQYAYAIFAACALLAWRFRRGRVLLALVLLALTGVVLAILPAGHVVPAERAIALQATAVLLPLNVAGLALLSERHIFSRAGLLRLGVLVAQAILVVLVAHLHVAPVAHALEYPILEGRFTGWTRAAQPALVAFGAATALIAVRLVLRPNVTERSLLWALAAALLAFGAPAEPVASTLYLAAAALILTIGVVEASYAMAYRDALTGLPARRALDDELARLQGDYVVAMADVDRFKRFNDRYGHDVGDQVLRMVATRLAHLPDGGRSFRYGGEEFAILFPGKRLSEVRPHLDRLRRQIGEAEFTIRGAERRRRKPKKGAKKPRGSRRTVSITVSIGAAERNAREATPREVISAADRALYRAKKSGRDRVAT